MKTSTTQTATKRPFNLTLNAVTVEQARAYTTNLSATVDRLLEEFVTSETRARAAQRALHGRVCEAWNRVEERHGAYGDEYSPL